MQEPSAVALVVQLLPWIVVFLPLVIGVFWLAPKMRSNPWVWAILFLIPLVNLIAMQIFLVRTAGKILDRLNAIDPVAAAARTE